MVGAADSDPWSVEEGLRRRLLVRETSQVEDKQPSRSARRSGEYVCVCGGGDSACFSLSVIGLRYHRWRQPVGTLLG